MMENIAIYGAGGFGKEVACHLNRINLATPHWNLIGFFDDGINKNTQISRYGEILGGIDELNNWEEPINIVLALGSPSIMKSVVDKISNSNVIFPNIVLNDIRYNDIETFQIGIGNIINSDCIFSCDVKIGNFNIFNGSVSIGHDVNIGSFNAFMPSVKISGEVSIGNGCFFGVGSIVIQQIRIGENVRIGAGSVLTRKPKNGSLYLGNPAKLYSF
jgi:sugar O-acyltransferase (sialic acid O-acetyltransferase NeuD family)